MRWWCAATTAPWDWTWRPYLGVWLLLVLAAQWYVRRTRTATPAPADRRWFWAGLACFWLATDWPIGTLGGGYLASAHTAQYILLTMCAAPLLLLGLRGLVGTRRPAALRLIAHPLVATLGYITVLGVTHLPAVSDPLMATQWGSFLIDMAWLAGGGFLWWAVLAPAHISWMNPIAEIGYLFVSTIFPTVPAAFLTFADYPVYRVFEMAPRVHGFPAAQDQQLAGLTMKLVADPFVWVAMGIIFFRWSREEGRPDPQPGDAPAVTSA